MGRKGVKEVSNKTVEDVETRRHGTEMKDDREGKISTAQNKGEPGGLEG